MKETMAKVLGSILRSLFFSIIMFVVVYSVITGEFPPNFARIKTSYQGLQKMAHLSREIHNKNKDLNTQYEIEGSVDDADLAALQELNLKRAEIGVSLLGEAPAPVSETDTDLQKKIQDLQTQVFRLQQRVSELESKNK